MTKLEEQDVETLETAVNEISYATFKYPEVEQAEHPVPINHLQDVEVPIEIVFGKKKLPIVDFLKLKTGSVITLDKQLSESVGLEAGGKVVAHGEIVVVDGHYGVKITEVL